MSVMNRMFVCDKPRNLPEKMPRNFPEKMPRNIPEKMGSNPTTTLIVRRVDAIGKFRVCSAAWNIHLYERTAMLLIVVAPTLKE